MPFSIALDVAAPRLIFLFGILPVLLGISVVVFAVYLILRAAKNRFGATNEIGVFEMEDSAGGGSLFGIFLGIAVVVLVVLVVIQAIMKRRKK